MHWTDPRSSAGQILVVVLLGIVGLAALVFYVINTGDQVNRRVAMQNAADSVAISGATWMARSMNVVAVNNVAQTRMLALVPVLDAFPLSVRMSCEETTAWVQCLQDQIGRGVPEAWLRDGLQSARDRLGRQRDILAWLDGFFNGGTPNSFDVAALTFWAIRGHAGPPPHGRLWQAAQSLDEMAQAAAISAGELAQSNAVRFGRLNDAETAFIVPILPEMPAERTSFADFERPVKLGRIPDEERPHRLGPYDRLFKWRDYQYHSQTERDRYVPPTPGQGKTRGGGSDPLAGDRTSGGSARGQESQGHWTHRTIGTILYGYTVYGPYEWMRRRIHEYATGWHRSQGQWSGELADTYFREYHRKMSDIKLGYMWGSRQLEKMHYPQWITDYPQAKALAERSDVRVTRTMYYVVDIRSKYPNDDPRYLTPKTYATNADFPQFVWKKGWQDPAKLTDALTKKPLAQIARWIWEWQDRYETVEDWDIGIKKQIDPRTGQAAWQDVYFYRYYVFGGIDQGGEMEIRNPANYGSDERDDLPAPILIDTAAGDYDTIVPGHDSGVRRRTFTYLGLAKKHNSPLVWPQRFGSGNPFPGVVSLAQVEIFNTRSWDLWTQDWKVKLVPVTGWTGWTDRMGYGIADAHATNGMVNGQEVQGLHTYLSSFDPDLVTMILHH